MKNRAVGILIIGIAALIAFIIYSFNTAMTTIVGTSCSHGPSCPMWGTIDFQTNLSIGITIFVAAIGVYLVFFGKDERIITRIKTFRQQFEPKKITKENYKKFMAGLSVDEKIIFGKIVEAQGSVMQSKLMEKTPFKKVKITRLLDKLEGRGLIERKRRGMTNVVMLKH